MSNLQKILSAISSYIKENGNIETCVALDTIVNAMDGIPSYIQEGAVLAGFGVKEDEDA